MSTTEKPAGAVSLSLNTVSRVFRMKWRQVLLISLASGVVWFAASFLLRPTFKATAIVMPPQQSSSGLLSLLAGSMGGSGGGLSSMATSGALSALGMKNSADMYVALMKSPSAEDSVIEQFNLQTVYKAKHRSQARKTLENHMRIFADPKSGLITVAVEDHDAKRAADIANAIVLAYDKISAHLAITDAQRRRLFLEQQVDKVKADLATAEDSLRDVSEKTGIIQPEVDVRALVAYETTLRGQIAVQSEKINSMRSYMTPDNPTLKTAQAALDGLEAQVAEVEKKQDASDPLNSRGGETTAILEYARKLRDVRYNEVLFEGLSKALEAAKLDEAEEGSVLQIVDPASPPDMKFGPHRSFFLAGGFLLGFLISLLWAVYKTAPELQA